jgi:DNA-binding transcriptional regulator YiaG
LKEEASSKPVRFSAKGLVSQRKRLGLSAEDCGLLVGASGQSVYNWESGKARPREKHLAVLAALKSMGKKAVATRLSALREA